MAELTAMVITVLIVSGLVIGAGAYLFSFQEAYSPYINGSASDLSSLNHTAGVVKVMEDTSAELNKTAQVVQDPGANPLSMVLAGTQAMISTGFSALKVLLAIPGMIISFASDFISISVGYEIPSWLTGLIPTLISVIVILAVVSALIKWRP